MINLLELRTGNILLDSANKPQIVKAIRGGLVEVVINGTDKLLFTAAGLFGIPVCDDKIFRIVEIEKAFFSAEEYQLVSDEQFIKFTMGNDYCLFPRNPNGKFIHQLQNELADLNTKQHLPIKFSHGRFRDLHTEVLLRSIT